MPTRSTIGWFVYGSSGFSIIGTWPAPVEISDGTGVAVISSTKPVRVDPGIGDAADAARGGEQDARTKADDRGNEEETKERERRAGACSRRGDGPPGDPVPATRPLTLWCGLRGGPSRAASVEPETAARAVSGVIAGVWPCARGRRGGTRCCGRSAIAVETAAGSAGRHVAWCGAL